MKQMNSTSSISITIEYLEVQRSWREFLGQDWGVSLRKRLSQDTKMHKRKYKKGMKWKQLQLFQFLESVYARGHLKRTKERSIFVAGDTTLAVLLVSKQCSVREKIPTTHPL